MHTCTSDVVLAPSLYFGAPVFGAAGGGGGGGGGGGHLPPGHIATVHGTIFLFLKQRCHLSR